MELQPPGFGSALFTAVILILGNAIWTGSLIAAGLGELDRSMPGVGLRLGSVRQSDAVWRASHRAAGRASIPFAVIGCVAAVVSIFLAGTAVPFLIALAVAGIVTIVGIVVAHIVGHRVAKREASGG